MNSTSAPSSPVAYAFGPFRVDLQQHLLLRGDESIPLTAKAYETLVLLLQRRQKLVTKEDLLSTVWPDSFVSEDSLTQAISMLRKGLGDDPSQPAYIATVPRRGYRFRAPVEEIGGDVSIEPQPLEVESLPADDTAGPTATQPAAEVAGSRRWPVVSLAGVAAVLVIVFIARTAMVAPRGTPTGAPIRFVQTMPAGTLLSSGGELSPDGRYLTFTAQDSKTGVVHLWLRPLDVPTPRMLAATEGAYRPFWSPDSQSIGFFADGKLKRIGVSGTPPQTLAAVGYRPSGGSWSTRGVILYADRISPLYSVPENGGEPTRVTAIDTARHEVGHHGVHFLPDGDHFIFSSSSTDTDGGHTYIGSLGSSDRIDVLDSHAQQAMYVAPGYLLYIRDNVLFAQRFDLTALRVTGAPMVVPTINAAQDEGEARVGWISASANGLLTFGGDLPQNHLTWYERSGRELEIVQAPTSLHNPSIAPDGRSLVADGNGIWLVDLERGAPTRLASNGNLASWSADGARVVFTTRPQGRPALISRAVMGHEEQSPLVESDEMKIAGNSSPDGRYMVFVSSNPSTRLDLWTVGNDDTAPRPFLKSPANELHPQISPDGKWLAYASDESGSWEVYVQTFPTPGDKRTISVGGGAQPQWRKDGRELYYISPDGMLMAVPIRLEEHLVAERPRPLFHMQVSADIIDYRNQYAASASGDRFVVDVARERDPLNVVVNWTTLVNP